MGDFNAFPVFIGCVVYFFLFVIIVTVGEESGSVDDYLNVSGTNAGYCASPRIAFNVNSEEYDVPETSERCIQTRVSFDEAGCDEINGCEWEESSTFLFWTVDAGCYGSINLSNYTSDTINGFSFYDVCSLEYVQNQEDCYNLGCTWSKDAEEIEITSSKNIFGVLGSLFTFRYDFGFTGIWNTLFIFVFFYIPFLLILGTGYFMLPFLH